jgi:hypothetical protein
VSSLGWHDAVDVFMHKWNSIHGGSSGNLGELEDEDGGAGVLHTAVAGGHADCTTVLLLHGFTRYVAQCSVVAAAMGDEACLLRLLLFTKTAGSGGGADVLLQALQSNPLPACVARQQMAPPEPTIDISLLLPLLAALCVWHNMVDPLVVICIAAWETGVEISGCLCIQDECKLCLSPAAAAPLLSIFAKSPLLSKKVSASPLHIAAASSATAAAAVLLSHGDASLDLNALDSEGCTALMWCMRSSCIPLAKLLLISGADVNVGQEAADLHIRCRKSGNKPMPAVASGIQAPLKRSFMPSELHWTRLLSTIGKSVFEKQPSPAPFPPPAEWGQKNGPALTAVANPSTRTHPPTVLFAAP